MATGRIGVTPVLRTRWSKLPTTGTTVLSGLDDNSVALVYDAGYEAVYRNGVLLSRGNDYTATNGTTITLIDATLAGDVVEVFANDLVPLTDAISKGQYNAKGALLSATAASTPAVLAVGTNNQVLTADSTTSTGLKWATVSSSPTMNEQLFTSSGTFTAPTGVTKVELFVAAGGGGGGGDTGGNNGGQGYGGGQGGVTTQLFTVTPGSNYTVTIGGGGTGNNGAGGNGTASSFDSVSSTTGKGGRRFVGANDIGNQTNGGGNGIGPGGPTGDVAATANTGCGGGGGTGSNVAGKNGGSGYVLVRWLS